MKGPIQILLLFGTAALLQAGCPTIPPMADFNTERYAGTWYETERFDNPFEWYTRCVSDTYISRGDGSYTVLYNRIGTWTGSNRTTEGALDIVDDTHPGYFIASFSGWIPSGDYYIIDTDYDDYSIVYSCSDMFGITQIELAWIMSRERKSLTGRERSGLYRKLRRLGIDTSQFIVSDQTGCDA
ncbi:apolipoprotein D-like [Ylistrum balloti]|uniref:apolipoprotein D-like n=1 Tax=Ylistrum balloti TaxID=509963 RepID=UPI002905CF72|nr:apolipoprotein D-like [Ylistrum balloti]